MYSESGLVSWRTGVAPRSPPSCLVEKSLIHVLRWESLQRLAGVADDEPGAYTLRGTL